MKRLVMKNRKAHKWSICVLSAFALLFYSFTFFTTSIWEVSKSKYRCAVLEEWFNVVSLMSFVDSLITMIVPFFIILLVNILIVCKLFQIKRSIKTSGNYKFRNENTNLMSSSFEMQTIEKSRQSIISECRTFDFSINSQQNRNKAYSKTTKTLLVLSVTFLVLNAQQAFIKIIYFFKYSAISASSTEIRNDATNKTNSSILNVKKERSQSEEIQERLACYFYYLQFSLNFFLYAFNSSKFRYALAKK